MLDSITMKSIPLRLWALAVFSAILQLLPFPIAGPAPLWRRLFCWFCLVPLLYAVLGEDRRGRALRPIHAALIAYLAGVIWYIGNCYWIYRTMHVYESIPAAASAGILLLFALYVGLYHALFGLVLGVVRTLCGRSLALMVSPCIWVAAELARARITGFPWDLLGYTQVDNLTLTKIAPITGVMGLSFFVVAVNALWLLRVPSVKPRVNYLAVGAAVILTMFAVVTASHFLPSAAEPANGVATLVQENLGVGKEAVHETKEHMLESFTNLSLHPAVGITPKDQRLFGTAVNDKSQLIAWPEAPTDFIDSDPELRQSMSQLAIKANAPVVVNAVAIAMMNDNGHPDLYNSASFFLPDGSYAGHYDKMHLVPFGEYTPYKPLFFFVGHLLDGLNFIPGTQRTLLHANGRTYGVFICYESIFGDDMRKFAKDGAQVLVNISDDGWYGDTSAPWEHLDMVRMRAIESRRWIVRATNTGITASIDPLGRVIDTLPRHIRSSLQVAFGYRDDVSFYSQHGDWFAWFCMGIVAGVILVGVNRRRAIRLHKTA
jgi:apolipoprotein N-acyltransferase